MAFSNPSEDPLTAPRRLSVVLADGQELTAAGISGVLKDEPDIDLVSRITDQTFFKQTIAEHQPSVVIADYATDGFITPDDLATIKLLSPATKLLIVSGDNDKKRILDVLRLKVNGYLTKDARLAEITSAVRLIHRGEKIFGQKILNIILENNNQSDQAESNALTNREKELLLLLAKGYSAQRAADELFVSPHTIHSHRKKIIKKLNIQSPTQYVLHAIELGLIIIK